MMTETSVDSLPVPDEVHAWSVLHARPRCEKKLFELCRSRQWHAYLPLVPRRHQYGKRLRTHQVPLFPGYLFVLTDQVGRSFLRGNQHVANLLLVDDQQRLLDQLNQVKRALDQKAAVELLPQFTTGMKVMVQSGPMKGVEGFVERIKNNTRIILNVDFIQQSIAVEVDTEWLIPC